MFGLGWSEVLLILLVALLVLGPKALPNIARSLGKGVREFRRALSDIENMDTEPPKPAAHYTQANEPPEKQPPEAIGPAKNESEQTEPAERPVDDHDA